jgi:hypothetical protein
METVERSMIDFGEDCLKNGTRYRYGVCVSFSGGGGGGWGRWLVWSLVWYSAGVAHVTGWRV